MGTVSSGVHCAVQWREGRREGGVRAACEGSVAAALQRCASGVFGQRRRRVREAVSRREGGVRATCNGAGA